MKDVSFKDLFNTLFNGGLRNFKYKNSHAKVVNYSEETKVVYLSIETRKI